MKLNNNVKSIYYFLALIFSLIYITLIMSLFINCHVFRSYFLRISRWYGVLEFSIKRFLRLTFFFQKHFQVPGSVSYFSEILDLL